MTNLEFDQSVLRISKYQVNCLRPKITKYFVISLPVNMYKVEWSMEKYAVNYVWRQLTSHANLKSSFNYLMFSFLNLVF